MKQKELNYVMRDGNLYEKGVNRVLIKCLGREKSLKVMAEVHEGLCGSHRVVHTIKWLIYRHGYY